jgi:hypothetical protein
MSALLACRCTIHLQALTLVQYKQDDNAWAVCAQNLVSGFYQEEVTLSACVQVRSLRGLAQERKRENEREEREKEREREIREKQRG